MRIRMLTRGVSYAGRPSGATDGAEVNAPSWAG